MKIDRAEARRIADLAHLEFDDAGLDRMAAEMTKILTYIDQLREVDVEGFEERERHVTPMREDEPRPSVDREVALNAREQVARNAPAWRDGFFVVPKVIGGD
ncbi:MAG: Asp-tRNA(Asn)/Glu-tRNA(Gln) amidotransferase GatCAB subunit C [Acidobacteria bacterium]|nr:MAG: Asp-tRNA(Asn)/Glu-tRNA(Gln) amidotransferase GatCAB subunit C [Acidobacteriota bacterium]